MAAAALSCSAEDSLWSPSPVLSLELLFLLLSMEINDEAHIIRRVL